MPLTSFVILGRQYEFLTLPFGLANAPKTFMQVMTEMVGHLPFVKVFLDEFLIFSNSESEHLIHLSEVLRIFNDYNATINFKKCSFAFTDVDYLGVRISKEGTRPITSDKLQLEELNPANALRKVQRLLGIVNWFRPYIPNLSKILSPVTDLLRGRKSGPVTWTQQHQSIISNISLTINSSPTLAHPDLTKLFFLQCDASDKAYGSVLFQDDKVIGFHSQKFHNAQLNYTIMEKEALGVINSLIHFRALILGAKITVQTNHSNLLSMKEESTQRVQRWFILLSEYNVVIQHIPGKINLIADFLSRFPVTPMNNNKTEERETLSSRIVQDNVVQTKKINTREEMIRIIRSHHEELNHPDSSKL